MAEKWVDYSRLSGFLKKEVKSRYSPPYGKYIYKISSGQSRAVLLGRDDKRTHKILADHERRINDPVYRKIMGR